MKKAIRLTIDSILTAALLCLMALQVTGEELHEWIGIGMVVLLIVHHILNGKWYSTLSKGKITAYRAISAAVNTLLIVTILATAFSGMSMSVYAVPFMDGMISWMMALTLHVAMSYWSFVLMGFHLGMHLPAMTAKIKPNKAVKIICTTLFSALAAFGLWLLIKNEITDCLLFKRHFAFFDYSKPGIIVFLENIAMLFTFVFAGANTVRIIKAVNKKKGRSDEE